MARYTAEIRVDVSITFEDDDDLNLSDQAIEHFRNAGLGHYDVEDFDVLRILDKDANEVTPQGKIKVLKG